MNDNFQTNRTPIPLYTEKNVITEVIKVGILPFVYADPIKVMVMKPHAEAKHLGPPDFQIAKGTRRINVNGDWCDMREDDLIHADKSFYESYVATALREGQEEIGLKSGNIKRLFDMGEFTFKSARGSVIKPMRMFAAEIIDIKDFTSFESTTSETDWLTPQDLAKNGRPDHYAIIKEVVERLQNFL